MTAAKRTIRKNPIVRGFEFFASYGFAVFIFLSLLLLTYLGTLDQIDNGLYASQEKYFSSIFLVHHFFGVVPMVLPGGYLLMVLLTLNLFCGGILRMRKGRSQIGVLIIHLGMLLLMAGAFITYKYSVDGNMMLYEHQRSNVFQSYHDWEIALTHVTGASETQQYIINTDALDVLNDGGAHTFQGEGLPFQITLSGFAPNTTVMPKGPMFETSAEVIDGYFLKPIEREPENERNMAGCYADIQTADGQEIARGILWGMQQAPFTVEAGGERWDIDLRRRSWPLDFTIVLDKFTRELHPRTNTPRVFMSDITKIENGSSQKIKISMNEPLRYKGYTFFQASFGPPNAPPGTPMYSVFAVVRNPADQFPLYACIVITFGLLIHFTLKLFKYLRAENRRHA